LGWAHGAFVALALEENLKANERVDLKDSHSIYPTIARSSRDGDLGKPSLTEEALAKALKAARRKRPDDLQQLTPIRQFIIRFGFIGGVTTLASTSFRKPCQLPLFLERFVNALEYLHRFVV
jgi:hypothetical protein